MKKILLFCVLLGSYLMVNAQYLPLSTILTYFETGDTPTESQFAAAWANSYNAVSDGVFDLTGYPSISFVPYSTMQVGKFYTGSAWPADTNTVLVYNGTLKVPNLWVNGQKWTGTGSSEWTLASGVLYPTSLTTNVAINSTSTSGYDLFINGTTYSTSSIRTNTLDLENLLTDEGAISIDGSGNMQFSDEFNISPITLSSLGGAAAWSKVFGQIFPTVLTDTLSVGAYEGDSLFNVYGTSYFENQVYFDSTLYVDGIVSTDRYIESPSFNLLYNGYSGRIDLYNATGKMTLYDSDFPGGVTLSSLSSGEWTRVSSLIHPLNVPDNVVIGATTAISSYDLTVAGSTNLIGNANIGNGITMAYGSRIQFSNGYISNSSEGLLLNDAFNGTHSLTEIMGIYQDSISASRVNTDTIYFNDLTTRAIYSPKSDNIFMKINSEEWRLEAFEAGATDYGILHSDGFVIGALMPDAMQSYGGFAIRGRTYMSAADTTIKYFTGKTSEWRTLATEGWVSDFISGGLGLSPTLDTIYFNATDYFTGGTNQNFKFASRAASGDTLTFSVGAVTSITSSRGPSIELRPTYMNFNISASNYMFDGTYWRSVTDTLADRDYARTMGGGSGPGTPGGSSGDLQYNNTGSFGGFWDYDGTNISPTTATGLTWSANSFMKGYSGDSIATGRTVNVTNNYAAETAIKQNFKSLQGYAGGYLNSLSNVYLNYNDANANSGNSYGVYSNLYIDENFASTGNTSYSNSGRFIVQNRGTTTIGGGSPGTLYMNGVYGEVTGTIDADGTPGTYILAAIFGKNSNAGTATGYAGYFDGNVNITGNAGITGTLTTYNIFTLGDGGDVGSINTSDWDITTTGIMTGITGITNDAAITSTGGIVSLNASSNFVVNVATGTSTGAISLGGGSNTVAVNSTSWDITTAGAFSGLTTLSMSNQLTNTLAIGTSPFSVTSTTVNTNLNADLLDGQTGSYYQSATNITAGTLPGDRGVTAGSASSSFVEYNGTTPTSGQWDGSGTLPSGSIRMNFGGYLYSTRFYGDIYSTRLSALTDTFGLVMYPGGLHDTATLKFASKGWEGELEDFDTYYAKAFELKSLPLPYPNGVERRQPNAVYMSYQFEYELERLTRYLKNTRDQNKILTERLATLEKRSGIKVKKNRKHRS